MSPMHLLNINVQNQFKEDIYLENSRVQGLLYLFYLFIVVSEMICFISASINEACYSWHFTINDDGNNNN